MEIEIPSHTDWQTRSPHAHQTVQDDQRDPSFEAEPFLSIANLKEAQDAVAPKERVRTKAQLTEKEGNLLPMWNTFFQQGKLSEDPGTCWHVMSGEPAVNYNPTNLHQTASFPARLALQALYQAYGKNPQFKKGFQAIRQWVLETERHLKAVHAPQVSVALHQSIAVMVENDEPIRCRGQSIPIRNVSVEKARATIAEYGFLNEKRLCEGQSS